MIIGQYDFEGPFNSPDFVRPEAGLYAIVCVVGQQANVIDIGESGDLQDRLYNHDRKGCWTLNCVGALGIAVLYTPGWTPEDRRGTERMLRQQYNPPCGVF